MKKRLFRVLSLLLCIATAFVFAACGDNGGDKNGGDKTTGKKISAGVVAGNVIETMLDQDYINVNLDFELKPTKEGAANTIDLTLHAKKTDKGYDVIMEGAADGGLFSSNPVSGTEPTRQEVRLYMIDGVSVTGVRAGDEEFTYDGSWAGHLNEALASAGLTKAQIAEIAKAAIGALTDEIDERTDGYAFDCKLDAAKMLNDAIAFIKANKDKSIGQVLTESAGITEEVLKQKLTDLFKANQSTAGFIRSLEKFLNELGVTVNFKTLIDGIQTGAGFTTAEVVDFLKTAQPELAEMLTDPEEGQTLYDYLMSKLEAVPFDMLAAGVLGGGNTEATAADLGAALIEALFPTDQTQAITFGAFLDLIAQQIFTINDFTQTLSVMSFNKLSVAAGLKIDSANRITELSASFGIDVDASVGDVKTNLFYAEGSVKLTMSYAQPSGVTFAIPSDISFDPFLCVGDEVLVSELDAPATKGYSFKVHPGQNTTKVATLESMYFSEYLYAVDNVIKGSDGTTVYARLEGDTVTLTPAFFADFDLWGYCRLNISLGSYNTSVYFT